MPPLCVEEVAADGVIKADDAGRDFDNFEFGEAFGEVRVERFFVIERMFVGEEHRTVGDCDDIIVERSRSDGSFRLSDEDDVFDSVEAGDCF
jgi:hypothetical protein